MTNTALSIELKISDFSGGGYRIVPATLYHKSRMVIKNKTEGDWGNWKGKSFLNGEENRGMLFSYRVLGGDESYTEYYSVTEEGEIKQVSFAEFKSLVRKDIQRVISELQQEIDETRSGHPYLFPDWWRWRAKYYIKHYDNDTFTGVNVSSGQVEAQAWEDGFYS